MVVDSFSKRSGDRFPFYGISVGAGETAIRAKAAADRRLCARCHAIISPEEAEAGLMKYGKAYCRHCFDERTLEDVSFEKTVEGAKMAFPGLRAAATAPAAE